MQYGNKIKALLEIGITKYSAENGISDVILNYIKKIVEQHNNKIEIDNFKYILK